LLPHLHAKNMVIEEEGNLVKARLVTKRFSKTLENVLQDDEKQKITLTPYQRLLIAIRILEAVQNQIHCYGIIHEDIKPENIMIDPETYEVNFIDMGLASDKKNNICKGTPNFVAREKWMGQMHDKKVDDWALGITLWEIFTVKRLELTRNEFRQYCVVDGQKLKLDKTDFNKIAFLFNHHIFGMQMWQQ